LILRKIGVYGGTFDPIHYAHLILAREACESFGLEKLIFVPAATSPFKHSPAAGAEMRLSMLRAAVEGETLFVIDDCELRRPSPSYTIDTIESVREREPDSQIYYLIGEDNVPGLPKWHRFAELERLVCFVVLNRSGSQVKHSYEVVQRKIDISATQIRNRIASGRPIRYLVPPTVEEIIRRHNLYRESVQ